MIQLTTRQKAILSILAKENGAIRVKNIANRLSCSERIVRYDLVQIEEYLKESKIQLVKKPRVGIELLADDKQRKEIVNSVGNIDSNNLIMSVKERRQALITMLLFADGLITTTQMAKTLNVSRQTIVTDLIEVKKYFKSLKLNIAARKGAGTYITGDEIVLRKLMSETLINNFAEDNGLSGSLFDKKLFNKSNYNFNQNILIEYLKNQNVAAITSEIDNLRSQYNFYMDDYDYISLIINVIVSVNRTNKNKLIKTKLFDLKDNQKEYEVAVTLADYLNKKGIAVLCESDINQLAVDLIACNIKFDDQDVNIKDNDLAPIVDEMLQILISDPKYYMPGYYYDKLKVALMSHLRLTIKKHNLNIPSSNVLLSSLKQNYSDIFEVSKKIGKHFTKMTHIPLSEDEIGFITIHIAANLEECSKLSTKTAIVICNTGQGVARVLCNRIRFNIPRLIIKDTMTYLNIEDKKEELSDVDFIISTFKIPDPGKPIFIVSPIITSEEIDEINRYINGNNTLPSNNNKNGFEPLEQLIESYVPRDDIDKFRNEISKAINDDYKNEDDIKRTTFQCSMIIAGICNLVFEGKKQFKYEIQSDKICGLIIHILMQYSNWKNKDVVINYKNEDFKQKNIKLYNYFVSNLKELSKEFNICIPDEEALSIIHYII